MFFIFTNKNKKWESLQLFSKKNFFRHKSRDTTENINVLRVNLKDIPFIKHFFSFIDTTKISLLISTYYY